MLGDLVLYLHAALGACVGVFFFFQAEDGIRDLYVTGVQTCALPISGRARGRPRSRRAGTPCRHGPGVPRLPPAAFRCALPGPVGWPPLPPRGRDRPPVPATAAGFGAGRSVPGRRRCARPPGTRRPTAPSPRRTAPGPIRPAPAGPAGARWPAGRRIVRAARRPPTRPPRPP